jgi:hypothetical protein
MLSSADIGITTACFHNKGELPVTKLGEISDVDDNNNNNNISIIYFRYASSAKYPITDTTQKQ